MRRFTIKLTQSFPRDLDTALVQTTKMGVLAKDIRQATMDFWADYPHDADTVISIEVVGAKAKGGQVSAFTYELPPLPLPNQDEQLRKVAYAIETLNDAAKRDILYRVIDDVYYEKYEVRAALGLEGTDLTKRLARALAFHLGLTSGDTPRDVTDPEWFGDAEGWKP